jgi:glycosyltransferase involved in cell wall biosynthesis
MRIAIDARFYGEAGPGRYCAQLLKNLEKIDNTNDYTVFLKSSNFDSYKPTNPRFKKVLANFHWYTLAEQVIFPLILYKGRFDLVHFTQINAPLLYLKPFVVTIHDVILHEFSTERGSILSRILYRLKKIPYHLVFLKNVFLSRIIIVPSRSTRDDLLKYYGVDKKKIVVTYESVDHYPSGKASPGNAVLDKYGIKSPYIFCLGSFYPHKNTRRLVEAFSSLKDRELFGGQLVLIGKESPFSEMLRNFVEDRGISDVIFPGFLHPKGYLPDDEVEAIMSKAFLYAQPALKEGFGIPPVEAMALGVPVAVSDIPCLKEMCLEAATYFNPESVEDMANTIAKVLTDNSMRRELVGKGYENIKRFSWKRMAAETFQVYERARSGKIKRI